MSQVALAHLACISPAFVSMIETGQRSLTRARDILALADALKVSPLYLADGREDVPAPGRPVPRTGAFPAREPAISPWLLLDQLAALHAAPPPAAIETP